MRTTLAATLVAGCALLIAFAFVTRSWQAVTLVLPFVLYLGLGALLTPPEVRVVAVRSVSRDRGSVGQEVEVRLSLVNEGDRIASLEVFDSLPLGLEVTKGRPHVYLDLARDETIELAYTVVPRVKGEFAIGPLLLRAREPLGLRYEERTIRTEATLVVAPRMQDVRKVRVTPRRVRTLLGQVRSRQTGLGLEFYSLRDYVPGDEIRHVNWKASARRDRLITNEYEAERSGDAIIILDARAESDVGPVSRSTTEMGISATVSLASRILDMRNRVGLIVQRDVIDWVYPGYGRKQLYRLVDALLHVRPGGEWPFENVKWVLARFFPPDAQVIIVSPLLDSMAYDVIADLRGHGFDVLVISPSPVELEREMHPDDGATSLAYRVLRMEREARIRGLREHADIVDWNPGQPLAVALKGVRLYPRRR